MGVSVVLRQVTKTYRVGDGSRVWAADSVSLDIAAGSRTALVGPSGSGKSTLLHLIGAIDHPDSGTITVDGQVLGDLAGAGLARYRAGVGFVFQQFHLVPGLSLLDNVYAPMVGRRRLVNRRGRALAMLDAVGLADRHRALPSQLSGGQQQRVAIARALVGRPGLLLADEPTGNLDSATAVEILDLLTRLQQEFDTTVVIATHDPGVAASCDDIFRVADGSVTADPDAPDRLAALLGGPRRAVEG
ncbi:MAG: ABC transporter ATP-binding protein [Actinobacteria bacterium]|nr:ABC transporter ATP-binding protein [Actinomycetota bacterium]